MNVSLSPDFLKKLKKLDVRIRNSFKERILVFSKNPEEPILDNHPLKREWKGYRSIDITADWRAIYKETQIGDEIVAYFVALGTHDELYKKS
ncbi:hypothetical protein A3J17_03030 [Candidatus Curtissbacteria bacterium RIFCSPLOWO2_02_FULL_40_11]|uniref:Addiction module toxin RelE n=2 Tax=Candidatus Curtissiibacteriota TaxID=1752717 RepID=A0A1F5GC68_9BACT|nr:MAG: hypothetical protein A3D04_04585 [Candidatus Curtissbacteria bacterium RIFCSPHIGHO2_02_FULL_40_16b]OGE00622.1 MAG: hypothetical protein A3J17_03030 [Candidatus Curtissbacteria bacterium RIFCSPLOWO2_02_FULL_40_11]OGE13603.1 MAG: hypothetical protein A3G14_02830 [Candidatus Curtissbacteria bacterium RIFCSPLOWO2_12_FULL_38_9]